MILKIKTIADVIVVPQIYIFQSCSLDEIMTNCIEHLFQGRLQSQDSGKHLHDVLDLLQKHTLVEADISAQAERIRAVQGAAQRFTSYEQGESTNIL